MIEQIDRAFATCEKLNRLPYADQNAIRAAWAELTGREAPPSFRLVPPFHSDHGVNIRIGTRVFINHGCTLNDIGGIDVEDDVMIGPNVSLISSGHPVHPDRRRAAITAAPIRICRNVWIGAGAMVLQGVTVGEGSVIAAGAVVTRDVPDASLVAGVPATVRRSLLE